MSTDPDNAPAPSALIQAACLKETGVARKLLVDGENVNTVNLQSNEETALHISAQKGNLEMIKMLLEFHANIEARNSFQNTPLHEAVWYNNEDCVKFLLDEGADINARDKYENSPLHKAALNGSSNAAEILVNRGASIDAVEWRGKTPLHFCVEDSRMPLAGRSETGRVDVTKLLIEKGGNINACDNSEYSVWRRAKYCNNKDVKKLFGLAESSESEEVAPHASEAEAEDETQDFAKDIAGQVTTFTCEGYSVAQKRIYKKTILRNSNHKFINMRIIRSERYTADYLAKKLLEGLVGEGNTLPVDDGRLISCIDWISSMRRGGAAPHSISGI